MAGCNLRKKDLYHEVKWGTLFACTIWCIWKMRNEKQFNNNHQREQAVATTSLIYAKEVSKAFNLLGGKGSSHDDRLISWSFSISGCIKINMDGSSSQEDHRGSFGGLVHNDRGKWVEVFVGNIGYVDSLKAELWGIRHTFKLCKEQNWK